VWPDGDGLQFSAKNRRRKRRAVPSLVAAGFRGTLRLTAMKPAFLAALLLTLPAPAEPAPPDFLRDVRPILSSHCFTCHGPDDKTRKGGLRLDLRDEALRPAKSDARAIVPGRPDESELLKRVLTSDEDDLMPPPATKNPLTDAQKDTLRRWIAAGAEYRPHWAFVPPVRPEVPDVAGKGQKEKGKAVEAEGIRDPKSAIRNPIDSFILARLKAESLTPSPEADRATLVRRVSLDLIGLPPTPEEADAFIQDTSPDAYERLVDRLLGSKHYGERWARRWLDLARYADTNGYEKDRPRSIWPWRDWVIRALNDDLPFDQFTVKQLAGDLLPDATPADRIATGFHRNAMINEEGGADPLEYRFHAMVDRVHVTATAWLGLTMACAQCHTHKYDPIQHREYFQFMAYLDNADEPVMDVPDAPIAARRAEVEARVTELTAALPEKFPPADSLVWVTPPAETIATESGAPAERLPDGSYRFGGAAPERDAYTFTFDTALTNVVALNLDALADDALPKKGPGRAPNGNFVLGGLEVTAAPREGTAEPVKVAIASATADFEQKDFPVKNAFDGKADTGWAVDGGQGQNRRATFRFQEPAGFPGGTRFTVKLAQPFGGRHVLGRLRLSLGVEKPDARPLEERRREHRERQFLAWSEREAERVRAWTPLTPAAATSAVPVLTIEGDATVFVSSDQTKSDTYEVTYRGVPAGTTAIRLEVLPDDRLPGRGPGRVYYEGAPGDFFLSTLRLYHGTNALKLERASHSFAENGKEAEKAADDDPQSGWAINGGQGRRHVAVFNLAEPLAAAADLRLTLLFERYYASGLGRFRLSATADPRGAEALALPDDLAAALLKPAAERPAAERDALLDYFCSVAPELAAEREAIAKIRREAPALPTTLVLTERPPENPRATYMRNRGEFTQPTERVAPGLVAALTRPGQAAPANRLEFARWLVSRDNPLTARVTVNREWQAFFGQGLVRTMEDFGFQGELPSHPELLDWLAVEFMEPGGGSGVLALASGEQPPSVAKPRTPDARPHPPSAWSLKKLHRLIVTSATYRQSSRVTPELLERDPQNRLLARGPRFRLEGELVRDTALRAAGLLSPKLGGPSVFPPQLASITREGAYGPLDWKVSEGEDRHRRGLYTFAKRTAPYATFSLFDAPSGEACVARREVSNTPLQSLALLNDEAFVEAAQALGRQAAALRGDAAARATFLFRRTLTRPPAPDEVAKLVAFHAAQLARLRSGELKAADLAGPGDGDPAERAAWTAVARALLNLDETMTRG
jgi:mono/diheme cytochrome c family protein